MFVEAARPTADRGDGTRSRHHRPASAPAPGHSNQWWPHQLTPADPAVRASQLDPLSPLSTIPRRTTEVARVRRGRAGPPATKPLPQPTATTTAPCQLPPLSTTPSDRPTTRADPPSRGDSTPSSSLSTTPETDDRGTRVCRGSAAHGTTWRTAHRPTTTDPCQLPPRRSNQRPSNHQNRSPVSIPIDNPETDDRGTRARRGSSAEAAAEANRPTTNAPCQLPPPSTAPSDRPTTRLAAVA